jgi:hypothetical protein
MNRISITPIARSMRGVVVCVGRSGPARPGQEATGTC